MQVLKIQNDLERMNVTGDDGEIITLSDICFKPLEPGSNSSDDCATMSILNYFQNNRSKLKYTENFEQVNYLYHIYYCTR